MVFNKFDLVDNKKTFKIDANIAMKDLSQTKNIEHFFISSFVKNDVNKIFKFIDNQINKDNQIKISTNKN